MCHSPASAYFLDIYVFLKLFLQKIYPHPIFLFYGTLVQGPINHSSLSMACGHDPCTPDPPGVYFLCYFPIGIPSYVFDIYS